MLIVYFLIISVYSALCAPLEPVAVKKTEKGLTVEQFDGYVGILKMFKDMLPKELVTTVENLNMTQKGEVVDFLSDWFQNQIQKPNSSLEIVDLLKTHIPSVYEKINSLNSTFYQKFENLSPESKNLLGEWKSKAANVLFSENSSSLVLLREFAQEIRDVKPEIREDLRKQFPSAVSLTEGLGFTVFTTVVMIFQNIVQAAQGPAVLASQLPVECKIPLD